MGKRLSKIVTRTGDQGITGLADGSRVPKDTPRVEAMGAVDELNSHLGVLLAEDLPDRATACLIDAQHDLFDLGGELSKPGHALVSDAHVLRLENLIEEFNQALPALENFILPGGSRPAALAHVARSACRRAERRLVTLSRQETVSPQLLKYLNRFSDLLFILGRTLNRHAGRGDVLWRQDKRGK